MICINSIYVTPGAVSLTVGKWYYGAIAHVSPENATCCDIVWTSSNTNVATVNASSGYIYAKSAGTARIYATAQDGSGVSGYLTVTVKNTVNVSCISLDKTSVSIHEGDCFDLTATVCPIDATNKSLCWESSDESIASVGDGHVCAIRGGTAIITASAQDGSGAFAQCTVTVTSPVSCITVEPPSTSILVGESIYLHATVCPSNATNACVSWNSNDSSIATVNSISGLVYAKKAGTATIYAYATDGSGVVGSCTLTVRDPILVQDISFNTNVMTVNKGCTGQITPLFYPTNATNKTVRWCSSKPGIVYVNPYSGKITARRAGKATVCATTQDGSCLSACCNITVKQTVVANAEETPKNTVKAKVSKNPIDSYSGAHVLKNHIMKLFGGLGLQLTAHYDSTNLSCGDLGSGWYHNYEKHVEICNETAYVFSSPSVYAKYVSNSDCHTTYSCISPDKCGYVLSVSGSSLYPYVIDCNSDHKEYYDSKGRLAKIVNHEGFATTIAYSDWLITITDSICGKSIYLEKDSECRVVKVYDDAGRKATIAYEYCKLKSVCDVNGNTITYNYDDEGRIISGIDAKNVVYFENSYDEYGRIATQKDAILDSEPTKYAYDDNCRTVTNRMGKTSTHCYDDNGLLLCHTDENGNTKMYEYDACCNVIKEADALGKSVIKEYNCFRKPTKIIDKNGNITYLTYDSSGNVTKITYPAINGETPTETFVYNSRNQIVRHTDIRGTVTVYTYDSDGMPSTKKVGSRNAIKYTYSGGLLKAVTDAMGNTTTYTHNAIGQVISVTDADNKVTSYEYDASGNLLKTTDANGKTVVNVYDGNYQKTSVTDTNGNVTEYSYNGNMKNDLVTLPDGHTVRYEFDGEDRVIKSIDQANNVTLTVYDDGGRVISKRFADEGTVTYEYDAAGRVTKETNQSGAVTAKTYDAMGNVLTVTDNDGNKTTYQYNSISKVTRAINASLGTTVYEYSKAGDLIRETDPLGNSKTYTYDEFGNRLTATDAKNNVTTYTYDQNNNLIEEKDALGNVTAYTYNSLNLLVCVKDAKGNTTRYGYDALGRRTVTIDARGNTFTTFYDGNGNVIKTNDAKGNTVSETVYNCLDLPCTVTDAMGKTTMYTYNALGKVETVTDPMNSVSEYSYDSLGRNVSVKDAHGEESTVTYDLLGNVTRLAGPLGAATNYTYDSMGKLSSETTSSGGTKSYTYNALNLKETFTNARGQTRSFTYDAKGRITGYTCPEDTVSYTYDANDNVLTVTDKNGTVTRTFDKLNRVLTYKDTYGKVIRYEYDAVGNLSKLIYPDNTAVTYAYDANHNLIRVKDWANRVTSYTYDENNRVVGVTKPDGSVTTTVYDNKQRVTSTVERTASGAIITGFEYTYDDLSRIVEEKILDKNTKFCYTYDELSRVTARIVKNATTNAVISTEAFTYDAAGNVTDAPDSCFQYDTNNRLISFNGNTVSYDLDGNMLSNGSLTCTYDSANRLVSAGGHTYTYNAEDVRIRNLCTDEDTTYTYNTNTKLSMLLMKTTNGVVTKYVYGKGLIGEEVSGAFKTYHFDCRGSTIAITDASGNITDTYAYDTYGKQISHVGTSSIIFGYNGRDGVLTESNGLIYMRARYYSPEMKRFINADIVAGEISDAVTLNRYAYANGNPVSNIDPFGLTTADIFSGDETDLDPTDDYEYGGGGGGGKVGGYSKGGAGVGKTNGSANASSSGAHANNGVSINNNFSNSTGNTKFPNNNIINDISSLPRTGSALKTDPHHSFPDIVDNYAGYAEKAHISNGTLYQIEGSLNGVPGRFEWITQNNAVTHRMFVKGGGINFIPIIK